MTIIVDVEIGVKYGNPIPTKFKVDWSSYLSTLLLLIHATKTLALSLVIVALVNIY